MRTLNEFAKSKSNFVSIEDGKSYTCIYKGYKFIEKDSFGETKEYARYLLKDIEDGETRNLDSMSAKFATSMNDIKEGTQIKISRNGTGMDTKYDVEVLDEEDIPVIEE